MFIEIVISVAIDCKSMEIYGKIYSRQGNAKRQKSETEMVHKNKTYKYVVDTCQNVLCLLLPLKFRP